MKKWLICMMTALLALSLLVPALAADGDTGPQLYHITDQAELLTVEENLALEALAQSISEQYGVGVYVVTVPDYTELRPNGVYEAAGAVYQECTLGEGEDHNGILLLLSVQGRDWALYRAGEKAEYAFTEYGLSQMEDEFLENFRENEWADGFEDYIEECGEYLSAAQQGHPVRKSPVKYILIFTGVSLLIALCVCGVLKGKMRTVRRQAAANAYAAGGLQLTLRTDQFLNRTQTRTRIQQSSSSGSSSESGAGGGGRSGKF